MTKVKFESTIRMLTFLILGTETLVVGQSATPLYLALWMEFEKDKFGLKVT